MDPGRILREARRRAALTQRGLARRAGVAQPTIARIESGAVVPRVDTLDRLLEACGEGLYARERLGLGVDRTLIAEARRRDAGERIARAHGYARQRSGIRPPSVVREGEPTPPWRVLEVLDRHGVLYLVIGGVAAQAWGSPVVTFDLDVCYARDDDNLRRLAAALEELGAVMRGAPEGLPWSPDFRALKAGDAFTFSTALGPLDCLGTPAGTSGYEDLVRNATEVDFGDLRARVASLGDLIRMKLAAGRPKDRAMAEELGALQEEIDAEDRAGGARGGEGRVD